jgi:predicted acyltransferase
MSLPGFALEPGEDLSSFFDRAVLGETHLWRNGQTWDPEGLLSTLPAIATGICGALTGHWLRRPQVRRDTLIGLFLFGFFGILIGTLWGYMFPINKYLWNSSFAVYTAGYALMFLAFWY